MEKEKREPFRFGEKIRQIRERKGYTLKIVAQQAGVSESLVSQIELNRVSPAIDTLLAITDVLDINLDYLFEEYRRSRPVHIIRASERRKIAESDVTYEEVGVPAEKDGEHAFEAYFIHIPAGSHTHRGSYGHLGSELGCILEGKATFKYESETYTLEEGDSISFSASAPHVLYNALDKPLKALWVTTPPQRFVKM